MKEPTILLTGGSGRLGTELRALLPDVMAPDSRELNLTDAPRVRAVLERLCPQVVVHAAAYTNVGKAEQEREHSWRVNVEGTRNLVQAVNAVGAKLLHISTDYVFSGQQGHYHEQDPLGPPVNYYALTKLVAEEVARVADQVLVVRTSFRPREWPYPTAFTDVYTSQDYVDVIAPEIALAARHALDIQDTTLHIATERKSVYELARRRRPDVNGGTRAQAGVTLPGDVSLNTERWQALRATLT